jgi:nucleotide-binding universal stress UspA family protein
MEDTNVRILAAIDHSGQSLEAAAYISRMVHPYQTSVVLFHVESELFDIFYDYDGNSPVNMPGASHFSDWIDIQKKSIDINLEQAEKIFLKEGFPKHHISIVKRPMLNGIARDILHESQRGYDLLVTGKSGAGALSRTITGTVTAKLMSRTPSIPMVIVAGTPETRNLMFGCDGSEGSEKALSAAGAMLRKDVDQIHLCHVIRKFNVSASSFIQEYRTIFHSRLPEMDSAIAAMRREQMGPKLNGACQILVKSGFSPSIIRFTFIDRTTSRSHALVSMAADKPCGTLVVGRRGHTAVEEFFMGRVGRKAVELSENLAVWVI